MSAPRVLVLVLVLADAVHRLRYRDLAPAHRNSGAVVTVAHEGTHLLPRLVADGALREHRRMGTCLSACGGLSASGRVRA